MSDVPATIHVINLDTATSRWSAVVSSHTRHMVGTSLSRFRAITASEVDEARVAGRCTAAEKGCYLSHVQCITAFRQSATHLWMTEDDVVFHAATRPRLEAALAMARLTAWDILFTHVDFGQHRLGGRPPGMRTEDGDTQRIAHLRDSAFYGTSSYLIHRDSIDKVRRAAALQPRINLAWDMFLKWCSATDTLRAFACIPDATGLANVASQIQAT